mmetsp:Transcript_11833/g.36828  ORF Transcript_11833/g.36828 Transcript_11833/m.36828 type:complete len:300 (-) Transcript_11833:265-1164(-)
MRVPRSSHVDRHVANFRARIRATVPHRGGRRRADARRHRARRLPEGQKPLPPNVLVRRRARLVRHREGARDVRPTPRRRRFRRGPGAAAELLAVRGVHPDAEHVGASEARQRQLREGAQDLPSGLGDERSHVPRHGRSADSSSEPSVAQDHRRDAGAAGRGLPPRARAAARAAIAGGDGAPKEGPARRRRPHGGVQHHRGGADAAGDAGGGAAGGRVGAHAGVRGAGGADAGGSARGGAEPRAVDGEAGVGGGGDDAEVVVRPGGRFSADALQVLDGRVPQGVLLGAGAGVGASVLRIR